MSENTENPPSNGTATSSSGSTTFTAPGLLTDTTLEVHGRIFHVHSVILKLYSAYFRKFMDSADKQTNPIFPLRYEYVTVVDADNFWGLEAKSKVSLETVKLHTFKGDKMKEQGYFENMLCAMYRKNYKLGSHEDLTELVRLADFYCALPAVSYSLHSALNMNPDFVAEIPDHATQLLSAAYKLRHSVLFRECLVHVIGLRESMDLNLAYEEEKLSNTVEVCYGRLCSDLVKVQKGLMKLESSIPHGPSHIQKGMAVTLYVAKISLSKHYRNALPKFSDHIRELVSPILKPILKNNLTLDSSGDGAGEGIFADRFLCARITDEEMPWDKNAKDW